MLRLSKCPSRLTGIKLQERFDLSATVGVMLPGEYTFNTAAKEAMTIVSGAMKIQQPDQEDWISYQVGDTFYVPANSAFNLKIAEATAYLCLYG